MSDDLIVHPPQTGPMSPLEVMTVSQLLSQGYSVPAIADVLERSPDTIRRHLHTAKQLLSAMTPEFAAHWLEASANAAKKGDHRPAADALAAAGVVERRVEGGPKIQVAIGFAIPGLPLPVSHKD